MGKAEVEKGSLEWGKSIMNVLNNTGDSKFMWDRHNADEVAGARAQFNELKKKGFIAFKVDKEGKKTPEQITEFDPNLERIIMSPPMVGG